MLDWLSSKFIMIVAAILILASTITLINIQRGSLEEFELKKIANRIASEVDSISQCFAETKLVFGFDSNSDAQSLPDKIGRDGYSINITRTAVIVTQNSKGFIAQFSDQVHPWNPNSVEIRDKATMEEMDENNNYLFFSSSSEFVIEHKALIMEDGNEFHTFVYQE